MISTNDSFCEKWKPSVVHILPDSGGLVLDVSFVPNHDTIIVSTENRSLSIFQKRESNYWPSKVQVMPSNTHILVISRLPQKSSHMALWAAQENGTISEFALTQDTNSMELTKDILAHKGKITGLAVDVTNEWLISVSEDKTLVVSCLKTRKLIGSHSLNAPATCMTYDSTVCYCFIGDMQGSVTILKLEVDQSQTLGVTVINSLKGHSAEITDLSWHGTSSMLSSCSKDKVVIIWDIGGGQGKAFDLHYHRQNITGVKWWLRGPNTMLQGKQGKTDNVLLSCSLDGSLVFWLHNHTRIESAKWMESNSCQICGQAFFWNVSKIFEDVCMPSRQHHCRRCGRAVCNVCSTYTARLPVMGYQEPVRICSECNTALTAQEQQSMATIVPGHEPILKMYLDEARNELITVTRSSNAVKIFSLQG